MADKIRLSSTKPIKRSTNHWKLQKKMCTIFCIKRLPNGSYRFRKRAIVSGIFLFAIIIYLLFASNVSNSDQFDSNETNGGSVNVNVISSEDKQTTVRLDKNVDVCLFKSSLQSTFSFSIGESYICR